LLNIWLDTCHHYGKIQVCMSSCIIYIVLCLQPFYIYAWISKYPLYLLYNLMNLGSFILLLILYVIIYPFLKTWEHFSSHSYSQYFYLLNFVLGLSDLYVPYGIAWLFFIFHTFSFIRKICTFSCFCVTFQHPLIPT
jgi:hypothetical protein